MTYEDTKHEILLLLAGLLDSTLAVVQTGFLAHGCETEVKRIDYVAQVIVLTFTKKQPTDKLIDLVGAEARKLWPEMPDMNAVLFSRQSSKADLILDLHERRTATQAVLNGE